MRGRRHHEKKKSLLIGNKKGKRETRDWPNIHFTEMNDKRLEKNLTTL